MIRFLYRAYLGLLGMIGLAFKAYNNHLTNKALNTLFKEYKDVSPERMREISAIQTFGYREADIPELYTLPGIYSNFKLMQLLLKLNLGESERDELREYFYFKKQISIILRKKFTKKEDFSLELELYTHLYKNNLF